MTVGNRESHPRRELFPRTDGLLPPEMRRLKQLEDENTKLKKIVADLPSTVRCSKT